MDGQASPITGLFATLPIVAKPNITYKNLWQNLMMNFSTLTPF
jgi:hypothetical protein